MEFHRANGFAGLFMFENKNWVQKRDNLTNGLEFFFSFSPLVLSVAIKSNKMLLQNACTLSSDEFRNEFAEVRNSTKNIEFEFRNYGRIHFQNSKSLLIIEFEIWPTNSNANSIFPIWIGWNF